ncbi:hypothetical protein FRAAL1378 [Frankia alni ACN14a]|uniref:Uncharacterized protein n=1 Tax=Frankia alni (strain DSM 45986 / CECT 9034 / ACN14a) TaxID=326424 RepID=Q0RQY6_FRAAA|nr:hypothetical protein FRAAL1378 [Frankia alni ACN14a]
MPDIDDCQPISTMNRESANANRHYVWIRRCTIAVDSNQRHDYRYGDTDARTHPGRTRRDNRRTGSPGDRSALRRISRWHNRGGDQHLACPSTQPGRAVQPPAHSVR